MKTRRAFFGVAAGVAATALVHGSAQAASDGRIPTALRDLELEHGARLGVYARNMATGRTVLHRADELFPMCSTFKTLAASAVLRELDRDGEVLAKRIRYTSEDIKPNSPVTDTAEGLANGLTVEVLCAAAIQRSDNTAANLLLRELGGPTAITRFCRSTGDFRTRLDRWETELNSAEPWRVEDTTSPRAIGRTNARLVLGSVLTEPDRRRLTDWMLGNTTSGERFRAGLPKEWALADKTGGGSYGTNNDVGVAWTPDGTPVVLAVLTTKPDQAAAADNPLVARTAELLAAALG